MKRRGMDGYTHTRTHTHTHARFLNQAWMPVKLQDADEKEGKGRVYTHAHTHAHTRKVSKLGLDACPTAGCRWRGG